MRCGCRILEGERRLRGAIEQRKSTRLKKRSYLARHLGEASDVGGNSPHFATVRDTRLQLSTSARSSDFCRYLALARVFYGYKR
jgi:hypothetical protein